MINRKRNLKCYCCGETIHIGDNKTKVHKAKHTFAHTACFEKRANKTKLTLGDKVINFILEMVKR